MSFTSRFMASVIAVGCLMVFPQLSLAQTTTYTYTGHPFNSFTESAAPGSFDSSNFVSATIVYSAPLGLSSPAGAPSWTVSNGRCTISGVGFFLDTFAIFTDPSGNITGWIINAQRLQGFPACQVSSNPTTDRGIIYSSRYLDGDSDRAQIDNNPGFWTVSTGPPLVNVALASNGGTAFASSTYSSSYAASGVINGDRRGLGWGSNGGWNDATLSAYPDWLEVDFNCTKDVQEIDLFTVQDNYTSPIDPTSTTTFSQYGLTDFQVQYWTGSQWLNVPGGVITGNNLVWRKLAFSPIATSKVRVLVNGALNGYSRITEVEAYAGENNVPTTTLLSPTEGPFPFGSAPATVSLSATANDSDGSISKVEFYAGRTLVATSASLTNPYTATWNNVPPGIFEIVAVVTDNNGATARSSPVNILVYDDNQTNVALASNGATASASSTFSSAYPPSGVIDGNPVGVAWGAGGGWKDATPGAFPDWLEVNFNGTQSIQEVDVLSLQDNYTSPFNFSGSQQTFSLYGLTDFQVQYWTGSQWLDVPGGNVTGNNMDRRKIRFPSLSTAKIRVLVNHALDSYSNITEIEAWTFPTAVYSAFVGLYSPANNQTFIAPATVTLTASGSTLNYPFYPKMDFYAGTTLIATSTGPKITHTATWSNVPPGSYAISVVGTDYQGQKARSGPVNIVVTGPAPTNVALASNGGLAVASSTYNNITHSPSSAINGDRKGLSWGAGGGWNDATLEYPDWLEVFFDGTKSIQEIDVFTLQDNFSSPIEPTPTTTFSQYGLTDFQVQYWTGSQWLDVPGGVVTGNNLVWRKFTFSPISTPRIRVLVTGALNGYSRITELEAYGIADTTNNSPTVVLTSPSNNASFSARTFVPLTATAADTDGSISKVDFYLGSTLLETSFKGAFIPYYQADWPKVPPGSYAITAVATDNLGATSRSLPANITVTTDGIPNPALLVSGGKITGATGVMVDGNLYDLDFVDGTCAAVYGVCDIAHFAFADETTARHAATAMFNLVLVDGILGQFDSIPGLTYGCSIPGPCNIFIPYGNSTLGSAIVNAWSDVHDPGGSGFDYIPVSGPPSTTFSSTIDTSTQLNAVWALWRLSSPVNLASASNGAVAIASSTYGSSYSPASTINGDRKGLGWGSNGGWNDGTPGSFSDWLEVDFNALKAIREIDVFTLQDNYASPIDPAPTTTFSQYGLTDFQVQYWTGSQWLDVPGGVVAGNNLVWRKFTFSPVSTLRIRVLVNGALNGYSRITEVEAYGTTATPNSSPTVVLGSPANNASFNAPAAIPLSATANDSDGSISKVEFYAGTTLIATSASSANPYTATWSNAPAGSFVITAVATDNLGATTSSLPANIAVASVGGLTNLALGTNGGVVIASSTYSNSYSPVGAINGDRKGLLWGADGGWNDATQDVFPDWLEVDFNGTQSIQEVDVFTLQDNYTSPIDPAPATTFSQYGLTDFQVQYWTGSQWLNVPGGVISGNNLVWRKITFSPISTAKIRVLVNGALGSFSRITEIEAYGVGASGNTAPTSVLDGPSNNATFAAPATVALNATANDSDGNISKVEFYAGTTLIATSASVVNPYTASWNNVPAGSYAITVVATDNLGAATTSAVANITVTGTTPINVALAANGGVVVASSSYSTAYPASSANNGDRKGLSWGEGGGWNDGTLGTYPDWLEVDFSGSKSIQEIDVFTLQDSYASPIEPTPTTTFSQYGLTDFQVQYWTGSQWLDVPGGVVAGNNLVWRKLSFSPISTTKIRVLINGALNSYSRITEVEAYGTP